VTLVLDASLLVALASSEPAGAIVEERLAAWIADDEALHAPALVYYEVASGLRKAIVSGRMRPQQLRSAVALAEAVPLTLHPRSDLAQVVAVAGQLERTSVYDAVYVALAESLGGTVVVLDGPLYRNARARGLPVQLLVPGADQ
jgi:predicted nucleic acid-binding protein